MQITLTKKKPLGSPRPPDSPAIQSKKSLMVTSRSYGCLSCGIDMKKKAAEITLRPFERSDCKRLISGVPTPEAHGQWCDSFFGYPLDESRLQRYLDSASQPNTRAIFTALLLLANP
jgi:hypothetical protein